MSTTTTPTRKAADAAVPISDSAIVRLLTDAIGERDRLAAENEQLTQALDEIACLDSARDELADAYIIATEALHSVEEGRRG